MNAAERDAFGQAVRSYLLENPEIIIEAYELYQQQQAELEAANDQLLVRQLAQPWRGIVDAGVVVGLIWGVMALIAFWWRAVAGQPPAVPHDMPVAIGEPLTSQPPTTE